MTADAPTPPLVAASPVPPVVPDSEALSSLPASMLRPDDGAWYDKDDPDDQPSGSGVVPDKPALTLCAQHGGIGYCSPLCPAVTDDEAAAEAFHEAYERLAPSFSYETRKASAVPWPNVPENNKRLMLAVIADLRSAGFLIVHHTKET